VKARHVLIATGARPMPLTFPGADHLITSDQFLELAELPARIVMVGGGYIAAEFSHIAARAGARVTVLQRANRMLTRFEPELIGWLMERFSDIGVEVRTGATVETVEPARNGVRVHARTGNGAVVIDADLAVHVAGRAPDLDALDLAAAGVTADNGRLVLNEFLQSVSNPIVYAAGDAAGKGPPLTPVSSHDGKVVAATLAIRHGLTAEDLKQTMFAYPTGASDVGYML
jgi:glutathione reductase (NADPH)